MCQIPSQALQCTRFLLPAGSMSSGEIPKIRTSLGQAEKFLESTSDHKKPPCMQLLASVCYLVTDHSHVLTQGRIMPLPSLHRALQKLSAPKSQDDPPDLWQTANCI